MSFYPYQFLLASRSPRRKELLERAGLTHRVDSVEVEEVYPSELPAREVPEYLARLKGEASQNLRQPSEILISSDTIVHFEDKIVGKPESLAHAQEILGQLSGKTHEVISAVYLSNGTISHSFSDFTTVDLQELSDEQIMYYTKNYEVMDKAGAYAIQEWIGLVGIRAIHGCYFNVMGLPLPRLLEEVQKKGF
ncbi:Maf family nucleotide pyrophosphatase [Chitinophagales bacterium]|nr:Maf family nucleotide pyrophosphatase [Chitinophagales bacterium]